MRWLKPKQRGHTRAAAQLAQIEAAAARHRRELAECTPEPAYVLSHIEGGWEVPVARVEAPGLDFVVAATEQCRDFSRIVPLSCFSLISAFAEYGRLSRIERAGWAFVKAYPLLVPKFLEECPGYHTEQYALCVLRTLAFHRASAVQPEYEQALKQAKATFQRLA